MIETLIVFLCAIIAGIFSGLMPGIGGLVIMSLAYPFLIALDPVNIILFYVVMVSIDQYYNGFTSIILGMPGHSSNIPSLIEGHTLFKNGHGPEAIMNSAISSWFASIFSALLILISVPIIFVFYSIWNTNVQALIFLFTSFFIVCFSQNKIAINFLLFCFGLFFGFIGYNKSLNAELFTFGYSALYGGIPILGAITALFVIPMIVKNSKADKNIVYWPEIKIDSTYAVYFKNAIKYKYTIIRSSLIGSIGGFIPGLTYTASTLLAYFFEKSLLKRKNKYEPGNMQCLIASEGSNNAGVFTQMVPLLFLGIPITASEALIYNILELKGADLSILWFQSIFLLILLGFIISSTIGLFIAGKYARFLKVLNGASFFNINIFVIVFLFISIYILGQNVSMGIEHVLITLFLIPIGLMIKNFDVSPLLYGFFLHDIIFEIAKRMIYFYII
jgi:putative tricarboxylic transport membrane protein